MWLWRRVVNTWSNGWDTSWVRKKLCKWGMRALCLFRIATGAAEGELLWKASSTKILMKYFRSKLSQNLLGTRRSLWTDYIFISPTALVPRYLTFSWQMDSEIWMSHWRWREMQVGSSARWPAEPCSHLLYPLLCGHGQAVNLDSLLPQLGDSSQQRYQAQAFPSCRIANYFYFMSVGCQEPSLLCEQY